MNRSFGSLLSRFIIVLALTIVIAAVAGAILTLGGCAPVDTGARALNDFEIVATGNNMTVYKIDIPMDIGGTTCVIVKNMSVGSIGIACP